MKATPASTWLETNQRALSSALAVVRGYLSRHVARAQDTATVREATNQIEAAHQHSP